MFSKAFPLQKAAFSTQKHQEAVFGLGVPQSD